MIWTGTPKARAAAGILETRRLLTLVLAAALIWSVASVDWGGGVVHTGGGDALKEFFLALFPPELSPGFLKLALAASWQTVVHAVAGITLAEVIGLLLGIVASGSLGNPGRSRQSVESPAENHDAGKKHFASRRTQVAHVGEKHEEYADPVTDPDMPRGVLAAGVIALQRSA